MADELHGKYIAEQRKALWEVMVDAAYHVPLVCELVDSGNSYARQVHAAMLRAIADDVAPEEPRPPQPKSAGELVRWGDWMRCQRIRQRLLAAADEAEGKSLA
jgi:hypothetical protein